MGKSSMFKPPSQGYGVAGVQPPTSRGTQFNVELSSRLTAN
jgi:hypothetical protein